MRKETVEPEFQLPIKDGAFQRELRKLGWEVRVASAGKTLVIESNGLLNAAKLDDFKKRGFVQFTKFSIYTDSIHYYAFTFPEGMIGEKGRSAAWGSIKDKDTSLQIKRRPGGFILDVLDGKQDLIDIAVMFEKSRLRWPQFAVNWELGRNMFTDRVLTITTQRV